MLLKTVIVDVRQSGFKGLFGCNSVVNRFDSARRIGAVIRSASVD
jgi:hypothetical protein